MCACTSLTVPMRWDSSPGRPGRTGQSGLDDRTDGDRLDGHALTLMKLDHDSGESVVLDAISSDAIAASDASADDG